MQKIIHNEFGVRKEILKYHVVGSKLKGMNSNKPFVHDDEICINIGDNLCLVDEIKYYSVDTSQEIERSKVFLDLEKRVAGVITNNKEILLLKIERDDNFLYCFPGGHMRENETIDECLKREMKEETNIDISNFGIESICKLQTRGFGPEEFFSVKMGDQDIEFQDEHLEDQTSKLVIMSIDDMFKLDNVFPKELVQILKNKLA